MIKERISISRIGKLEGKRQEGPYGIARMLTYR